MKKKAKQIAYFTVPFTKASGKPSIAVEIEYEAGDRKPTTGDAMRKLNESGSNLSHINICNLEEFNAFEDLSNMDLHGGHFHPRETFGLHFENSDLSGADMEGACLPDVHFAYTYLYKACLTNSDLEDATIVRSNLNQANLEDASLKNAVLNYSSFKNANLRGADLHGAEMMSTDFTGANLDDASFPLTRTSLLAKIDKRLFCQFLYHTLSLGQGIDDEEVQTCIHDVKAVALANKYHNAKSYGLLSEKKKAVVNARERKAESREAEYKKAEVENEIEVNQKKEITSFHITISAEFKEV